MIRTQIQLPDELYRKLKQIGASQEWSLSEVVRRGSELMVRIYAGAMSEGRSWSPPKPRRLGEFRTPHSAWRELANEREDSD